MNITLLVSFIVVIIWFYLSSITNEQKFDPKDLSTFSCVIYEDWDMTREEYLKVQVKLDSLKREE